MDQKNGVSGLGEGNFYSFLSPFELKSVNGSADLHSQIFLLAFLHLASATSLCTELNKRDSQERQLGVTRR